jgi:hypothetical protein
MCDVYDLSPPSAIRPSLDGLSVFDLWGCCVGNLGPLAHSDGRVETESDSFLEARRKEIRLRLASVMIALVFLYMIASIFILGGELNAAFLRASRTRSVNLKVQQVCAEFGDGAAGNGRGSWDARGL